MKPCEFSGKAIAKGGEFERGLSASLRGDGSTPGALRTVCGDSHIHWYIVFI